MSYEKQGTAFDSGARGHELQGRIITDECRCSSCESGCLPANCGNGKCRATGACVDDKSLASGGFVSGAIPFGFVGEVPSEQVRTLPVVESPSIAPACNSRTVIGFTSSIFQSGKSEAARYLTERYGFERGRFAGALKAMLRAFLGYRGVDQAMIERMIEGDLKEVPSVHLNSRTPRHAMQTLGHEWGRQAIDFNLWVDTEMDAKVGVSRLVFDDVRYPNEVSAIRNAGGIIILVERPGTDQGAAAGHASEGQDLNHDLVISNDSTIEAFRAKIDDVLKAKSVVAG